MVAPILLGGGVIAGLLWEGRAEPIQLRAEGVELGKSVEGRSIYAQRFNADAGDPILIFSSIHGDERSAVELASRL